MKRAAERATVLLENALGWIGRPVSKRTYVFAVVVTCGLVFVAKFILLYWIPVSSLLAEDIDYLNKAAMFLDGHWRSENYPFPAPPTSPLYPLLLTPWLLVEGILARFRVAFSINFILASVALYFNAMTAARLSRRRLIATPLVLAVFSIPFVMSFYIMTENLLFCALSALAFLVTDFRSCLSNRRTYCWLVFWLAVATLARMPGFAVLPAIVLLTVRYYPEMGLMRTIRALTGVVLVPLGLYLAIHKLLLGSERADHYLTYAISLIDPANAGPLMHKLAYACSWTAYQALYIFLSTGYWAVPLVCLLAVGVRAYKPWRRGAWSDSCVFTLLSSAFFVGFCLIHLLSKLRFRPGTADFIYGRYDDPAVYLIVILAVSAALRVGRSGRLHRVIFAVIAPLLGVLSLAGIWTRSYYPCNELGLALFDSASELSGWILGTLVSGWLIIAFVSDRPRRQRVAMLVYFTVFNVLTIINGVQYTVKRSQRAFFPMQAALWIQAHAPKDAVVMCDKAILLEPSPESIMQMNHTYRDFYFCVYPNPMVIGDVRDENAPEHRFLFTLSGKVLNGYSRVWTNGPYALYECDDPGNRENGPVNARPASSIGLYAPTRGIFFLKHAFPAISTAEAVRFGPTDSTQIPLSGDWDGDGTDTIGLYNPATGSFSLRNSNSDGPADVVFRFGPKNSELQPLAGDWDGDGTDTVGLYAASRGMFYLANTNAGAPADIQFRFGPQDSEWVAIAGDWNGDGSDSIGCYDPANRALFLRNANASGVADHSFRFGSIGADTRVISGDWDDDGRDTIARYEPDSGTFFFLNEHDGGVSDEAIRFGPKGNVIPISGDWKLVKQPK